MPAASPEVIVHLSTADTIVSAVGSVVTWALVIYGWRVLRSDESKRDDRKELRQTIDTLIADVRIVETKSKQYYMTSPSECAVLQDEIISDQDILEARFTHLSKSTQRFQISACVAKFRTLTTGGEFESPSRTIVKADSRKIRDIALAAKEVIFSLEDEYSDIYPIRLTAKKWWFFGR